MRNTPGASLPPAERVISRDPSVGALLNVRMTELHGAGRID